MRWHLGQQGLWSALIMLRTGCEQGIMSAISGGFGVRLHRLAADALARGLAARHKGAGHVCHNPTDLVCPIVCVLVGVVVGV